MQGLLTTDRNNFIPQNFSTTSHVHIRLHPRLFLDAEGVDVGRDVLLFLNDSLDRNFELLLVDGVVVLVALSESNTIIAIHVCKAMDIKLIATGASLILAF